MFGTNEIVGQKFFKDAPKDSLYVTSIFYTLQGEGPFSGLPCVFVRLGKCNLACSFCFPSHYPITVLGKGSKRLDEVQIGDQVLTLDNNLKPVYTTVKNTASRWVDKSDMVRVVYKENKTTRSLVVTKDHPFNVKKKGFVRAEDLVPGQLVHHLPGNERIAHKMATVNPMHSPRAQQSRSRKMRADYASGRLTSYERDAEWRDNQSARMSDKNPMHNHDVVKKVTESKVYKKSGLEKKVHSLLKNTGYSVDYVGNKKGWMIGDSNEGYMRPDFHFKGTTKILEVYDKSYPFYTDKRHTENGELAYKQKRRAHYSKFGYDVGFLTAQQLRLSSGTYEISRVPPAVIRKNINQFLTNGIKIVSVEEVETKRINAPFTKAGTYKEGKVKVTNFTCDGNNTYCMKGLHTHNCDTMFDVGDWMTYSELNAKIYQLVCEYWNDRGEAVPLWALPHDTGSKYGFGLVITGGEPSLQKNLIKYVVNADLDFEWVQIESNGIINMDFGVLQSLKPYLVVSPKCAEKDGKPTQYLKPPKEMLESARCLKFVMSADQDSPYSKVPDWAIEWSRLTARQVYVSPMNVYNHVPQKIKIVRQSDEEVDLKTRSTVDEVISFWEPGLLNMEANRKNHEYTARYAITHGLRFQVQTHLYAGLA